MRKLFAGSLAPTIAQMKHQRPHRKAEGRIQSYKSQQLEMNKAKISTIQITLTWNVETPTPSYVSGQNLRSYEATYGGA